ncbi:MAG TPA: nucleotidyltransferase family protein [Terriglobales bacterium]|jgi:molybdenum cofactor cytidylyltransferase|nr:nucleotidyltransferase family protein [Terriglobales bacterium]
MARGSGLCGVVLCAGASTRMGRDKALLPWPPPPPSENYVVADTFLSAAIRSLSPVTEMVLVVAGHNTNSVAPVVYAHGASLVTNPDPARGQFSSMQLGLHEILSRGRDAAIVTLVDRPPARPQTIEQLREAFMASPPGMWAVVPEFKGKHGHPVVLGRELIEAFLRAPATATGRDVEHQHQAHMHYLSVDDPFVTLNVDTPEDYAALQNRHMP